MSKVPFSTRWLLAGLLFLALWLTAGTAYGQSVALLDAANQGRTLYGQGRYQEALPFAKKALRLGGQEFGTSHPIFATLLNNLAGLYSASY